MPTNNYIGINGLVTQDLSTIIADLTAKFKGIYGQNINVEQNSPDGQLINILAQEKKDMLDLITQFYNNLDVDRVVGIPQQILYKLNGLIIKAYSYSYVYVRVNTSQTVNLQGLDEDIDNASGTGYTVYDANGNRWILTNSTTVEAGTNILNFRAAEIGDITALPNTITFMETILPGVNSVSNPANNYITGGVGETPAEFRIRRNRALEVPSQGFEESIQSQLLDLENVTQAKVYSNRTDTIENDIPAHAVWVIVEGGDAQAVGRIIYNNIPPGIPMKGTQSVEITKLNGDIETVNFDYPNPINLYIRATIQNFGTTPLDEQYIKQKLALKTFEIGERAENAGITTYLKDILGETGSPYNVELSLDGTTWAEIVTPSGLADFFTITTSNITLTVVGS